MLLNRKSFFMKFAKTVFGILVIIVFAVAVLTVVELSSMYRTHHMDEISFDPSPPDHWPSPNWTPSSPEEQGMDSQKLIEMVERYRQEHAQNNEIFIDSISVFRNGYLVADVYFNPLFPQDTEHIINSCTKSIMSVLIGIAIDRGFIKNVDVPVYQLLNCPSCRFTDKRGDALTLKHLLTMQTGLKSRDSYLYMWEGLFQMQTSDDWVGYILDRPFEADPGSRFEYSNMASFLLSAVITRSTGMDTLSFAKKYLFEPLGIRSVTWVKSPQGIYQGFARMWLKPHDMGKIGQLYLQKGVWKDRRIVSQNWVEESIMAHSFPEQYRFFYDESGSIDFGKSGSVWTMTNLARPLSDGYGYQWWLDESGIIAAIGVGGQFIIVIPEKNMVVAVTSKLKGEHTFFPVKLLKEYIIPSVVSDSPLPENPEVVKKLTLLSGPPAVGSSRLPIPALPAMAKDISGNTYKLDTNVKRNPWQYNHFRLQFKPGRDHAVFHYDSVKGKDFQYRVGLNGIYQSSHSGGNTWMARGEWTGPDTFVMDTEMVGYAHRGKWKLQYSDKDVLVEEIGVTGIYHYKGRLMD